MNDDSSNKDFGYGSGYTSKKDTTDYFVKVRQKTGAKAWLSSVGKKRIIIICTAILLIATAITITIVILSSKSSDDITSSGTTKDQYAILSSFDDELSNYTYNGGTDEWFDDTTKSISSYIDESNDATLATRARIILANFYSAKGSYQEAASILNEGLRDGNISNQNTLSLLTSLSDLYTSTGQQEELIDTVTRIVNLPDGIKLEQGDWSSLKAYYQNELKQLTNAGE